MGGHRTIVPKQTCMGIPPYMTKAPGTLVLCPSIKLHPFYFSLIRIPINEKHERARRGSKESHRRSQYSCQEVRRSKQEQGEARR